MKKANNNISQQEFERIDAFIMGTMTASERKVFNKELETNQKLRAELEVQRKMILAVEAVEMKNQLNIIHHKLFEQKNLRIWIMVAASVSVLLTFGIWQLTKPDKAEKLFASNMTVEPGLPVPMSATTDYAFYDAMVDYKSEKYELAEKKWKTIVQQYPANDTLNYFIGCALFNQENYLASIPYFEIVSNATVSTFSAKSEWYLALSFLKTEDFNRLKILARDSKSEYADRINQLYQKLE